MTVEITEVRIKLMEDPDDRLQAFCSITIDDWFVIRDLKIIEGTSGPFVAMPSRKLTMHCRRCRCKNHMRASYCNQCGAKIQNENPGRDHSGRVKLYADIAHPINSECREAIQEHVIAEFKAELERSSHPDYYSRYDDAYGDYQPESDVPAKPKTKHAGQAESHRIEGQETPAGPHHSKKTKTESTVSDVGEPVAHPEVPESNKDESTEKGDGSFGAGIFD